MKARLNDRLAEMNSKKQELIKLCQNFSQDQLQTSPAADKWSVIQILGHLIDSENKSALYIAKKTSSGAAGLSKTGMTAQLKTEALKIALKSSKKFKAPAIAIDPKNDVNFDQLIKEWKEARDHWQNHIDNLSEEILSMGLFKHPIAGRMNMNQCFTFLEEHFIRHTKQIETILEKQNT